MWSLLAYEIANLDGFGPFGEVVLAANMYLIIGRGFLEGPNNVKSRVANGNGGGMQEFGLLQYELPVVLAHLAPLRKFHGISASNIPIYWAVC